MPAGVLAALPMVIIFLILRKRLIAIHPKRVEVARPVDLAGAHVP